MLVVELSKAKSSLSSKSTDPNLCEHGWHEASFLSAAGPTFHYVCNLYRSTLLWTPCMLVTQKIKPFVLINMNKGQSSSPVHCLQTAQLTCVSVLLLLY